MRILRRAVSRSFLFLVVVFVFGINLLAQDKPDESSCNAAGQSPGRVYRVGKDGNTAPRLIRTVDPEYTAKARQANIQGTVVLALVVDSSGNTTMIKVSQGLGSGLDEKATEAMRQWKFEPGTLHGKPVAIAMCAQVNFRLPK